MGGHVVMEYKISVTGIIRVL